MNTDWECKLYSDFYRRFAKTQYILQSVYNGFFLSLCIIRQWTWRTNQPPTMVWTSHHHHIRDGCWTWVGGRVNIAIFDAYKGSRCTYIILWFMINDAFVNLVHLDLKSNLRINCRHKRIVRDDWWLVNNWRVY